MDANKPKPDSGSNLKARIQALAGDIQEEEYDLDELMRENADEKEYQTWRRIQESEKE